MPAVVASRQSSSWQVQPYLPDQQFSFCTPYKAGQLGRLGIVARAACSPYWRSATDRWRSRLADDGVPVAADQARYTRR